jgi:hypothetical protein
MPADGSPDVGIERLRPEQGSAMIAILDGRDALVALPTGFGKSLIYQVPAMILDRPTIVVSPLIALMADQERALGSRGVPVVVLRSGLRSAERRAALERLEGGGRLIVLTTLRRSRHAPPRPVSSASGRRSCSWTRLIASRNGGTTSGRPTCGSARRARGWATHRRSHSRQPRRRTSARISLNGFACAIPSSSSLRPTARTFA